jgi:starch synthase
MKVLSVASEIFPFAKTGGLADVAGALPAALKAEGVEVRSLLPGYPAVLAALGPAQEILHFDDLFGGPARVLAGRLFALDAPHLFARPGLLYGHADDAVRFAALGWAAAEIAFGAISAFVPDVVHAHDWQAGLAPAYVYYRGYPRPGTVFTVHNLAFQGQFPAYLLGILRLPAVAWSVDGVEYYGGIGFLKAGLRLSDYVTTVSPTYAEEICTEAGGMGLGGLLRARTESLVGILNGIDTEVWNPTTDPRLPARYDAEQLELRADNKRALQAELGLEPAPDALILGVISRLAWQKGMDLLLASLPSLLTSASQLTLLGAGEASLQDAFSTAALSHPGRIGVRLGYDETLAHLIQGGADLIAVPSRFEPCGLTQLCGLRYGAVPFVARTGGLADTVIDANEMALAAGSATGFLFSPGSVEALTATFRRATHIWRDSDTWNRMQRSGMNSDVSWRRPARHYAALYRALATQSHRPAPAPPPG